uniref:Cop9 signalosome subunit 5 C-terminal domain-containing protein n=1 Tax=Euplotes harpa TaxID=151035 RepID=A0A7S3JKQ9_9SPIT|mmetsp:Transcript_5797/g.6791  ORF Transcript_5797/g.6791 Transcript_5797/m.6791 type:complete len:148 (+) Transcript_5797:376-819(+)
MDKIEDFGAHANKYYKLEHSIFKSELDQSQFEYLWNQYWVQTISTSSLLLSKESMSKSISDVSEKLNKYKNNSSLLRRDRLIGLSSGRSERGDEAPKQDNEIAKINSGSKKIVLECNHMIMAEILKAMVFSGVGETPEEHKDAEMQV